MSYPDLDVNSYAGEMKTIFENSYGVAIGVFDAGSGSYTPGVSISSNATLSRRSGARCASDVLHANRQLTFTLLTVSPMRL